MDEKIESLFELAGNSNLYQFRLAITTFFIWVNVNILCMTIALFEKLPDVEFYDPYLKQNVTSSLNYTICEWKDNYTITKNYSHSIVTSFEHDCDPISIGLLGTALFLGNLLGCFIFQFLIEKLGHKKTVIVNLVPLIASFGMLIISPSYPFLLVFFVLSEIVCLNIIFSSYLINSEVTCSRRRSSLGTFLNSGSSICGILYTFYCKYVGNWRYVLTISLGSNILIVGAFIFFSYESPRFYLVRNDFEKFIEELRNIARANNRLEIFDKNLEQKDSRFREAYDLLKIYIAKRSKILPNKRDVNFIQLHGESNESSEESANTDTANILSKKNKDLGTNLYNKRSEISENLHVQNTFKISSDDERNESSVDISFNNDRNKNAKEFYFFDFFRYASIRYKFLSLCFIWLTSSTSYYGLNFNIKNLNTDIYTYGVICYAFEVIILIMIGIIINIKFFGRKLTMIIFYLIAILCLMLYVFIGLEEQVTNIVLLIVRVCFSANYSIIYVYTMEIYPTPARARGFAINSAVSNFSSVIFPILFEKFPKINFYIFLLMNCLCLLFLIAFIPETLGKPLKEIIEEEEFGKKENESKSGLEDNRNPLLKDPLSSIY